MNDLALHGCRPEPLGSYLKALAVLRLVGEQKDAEARGYWRDDTFHLVSTLDEAGLVEFFAKEYAPTPIVGPWGARSGFFAGASERSAREALQKFEASTQPRLHRFRRTIAEVRSCLRERGLTDKAKDEAKLELLVVLRNRLPDEALRWLDAAYVLGTGTTERGFPIVLGTGGNEGSQGFASTFMNALLELGLVSDSVAASPIRACLLGSLTACAPTAATGQFLPGLTSGFNQGPGFTGGASASAWDMLLAFEGAATWVSGAGKRTGSAGPSRLSSPFTIRARAVGTGVVAADESKSRGEIWVPLWSRPSRGDEVEALLAEGRAQWRRRDAGTAMDIAKAAGSLGVDRGVDGFERHAVLVRNGKSFFAVALGRFQVFERAHADLVRELDDVLERLDRRLRMLGDRTPGAMISTRGRVEDAVFALARTPEPRRVTTVLRTLGALEAAIARTDGGRKLVSAPLSGLSPAWLAACADTLELRVAAALASIRAEGDVGPLRANLVPIDPRKPHRFASGPGQVAWEGNSLAARLGAVLRRRLIDAERLTCAKLPLAGAIALSAEDVSAFLEGRTDDRLVEELLFACTWIDWRKLEGIGELHQRWSRPIERAAIPPLYAMLKSVLEPSAAFHEPRIVPVLLARHVDRAVALASTRLRVNRLVPVDFTPTSRPTPSLTNPSVDPVRLAASLLIPVRQPEWLLAQITHASVRERNTP